MSTTPQAAARHYPLPDNLYAGSKDWLAGDYAERVEWLHSMYEARKADVERMETAAIPADVAPYYLWSHPLHSPRIARPSEATFAHGEPEWVREYPVEVYGPAQGSASNEGEAL